jgi:DNA-binding PadR family transcriptional regulator
MAYIDILILRHLSRRPAHGYELRKRIEATTGFAVNNNSLYPALRRFTEAGALTMTAEAQDGRPPRHVYELTGVGRELLHDLLAELPAEQAGDELEFLTRLGQFSFLEPDERLRILDARETALAESTERLEGLIERSGDEHWSTLVTRELLRRTADERQWLNSLRTDTGRV